MRAIQDRPLAAPGFTSYRCKGRYGWIMIGAKDDADALSEARRTKSDAISCDLEIWVIDGYMPLSIAKRFHYAI